MHILIATGLYAPQIGGPATHTRIMEEELPSRGVTLRVVPFSRVLKLPSFVRHIAYLALLMRAARGAQIIYALDPVSVGLPALVVSRLLGKRFILRVAGDFAWEQASQRFGVTDTLDDFVQNSDTQPFPARMLLFVERFVARRADHIIVPSEYLKRIVGMWGVTRTPISVVYNTVVPHAVSESKEALRRAYGHEGVVMVSAGRLVPWKGFRALIDAVALLKNEHPELTLSIAGDGPLRSELLEHIEEAGVADLVTLLGNLPSEELAKRVAAADIFVLNTGYEGFSHQLVEAMSIGTPIITTPVGGNTELLRDGQECLFVPFNDVPALREAILRFLNEPETRSRLSRAAAVRAHSFTRARTVEGVLAVLKAYA